MPDANGEAVEQAERSFPAPPRAPRGAFARCRWSMVKPVQVYPKIDVPAHASPAVVDRVGLIWGEPLRCPLATVAGSSTELGVRSASAAKGRLVERA